MNGRRVKMAVAGATLLLAVGVLVSPAGHPRHLLLFLLLWLLPAYTWAPLLPGTRLQRLVTAAALPLLLNPLLALLLHYLPGAPSRLLLLSAPLLVALLPLAVPDRFRPAPELPAPPRAVWPAVGGLLLTALLLRGVNVGYKEFQGDEGVVLVRAAAALTGDEVALFLHQKGPLEILVPFLTWGTGGTLTELWARLPFTYAAVLGVAAVVALAAWWTRSWDRGRWPAALLAGAGLALAGLGVAFGRIVQYQSFVVLFGTLSLLHAARYRDGGSTRHLWLSALFLGGGLLAHYDAVLVGPAVAWLLLPAFRRAPRRWIGALLAGGAVVGLFYLPFALQPTFADTVAYLLNERVGAGGGGGWLSWTAPLAWEMGIFYLGIYYVVGFLLLLLVAALVGWRFPLRRLPAAAWLHLLVPLIFYTLIVVDPRTHIYTILPGGVIIAAAGGTGAWQMVRNRPVRLMFGSAMVLLLLLSGLYAALLFVQTAPERQRTWSENRPAGFPTPFEEPPLYGRFGFPYQAGWRAVPELLPDDAVWYASNEEEEVTAWYMAQRPRTFCTNEDLFLLARRVQDEVPYDPALLESRQLRHQITVDGRPTLLIYQREPAEAVSDMEANGRRLWRTPAEVAPPRPVPEVPLSVELGSPEGPRTRLLGYDLDDSRAAPGGHIVVTLYWEALTPFERNFQSFVHIYDGVRWAQHDGAPACAARPTSGWTPGQIVADPHIIPLPEEIPAGPLPLYAGMYDLLTLDRLPITSQPDNWIRIGTVEVGDGQ